MSGRTTIVTNITKNDGPLYVRTECPECAKLMARAQLAERLLHDLTPTGSEFVDRPQKCFEWIRDYVSGLMRIAVDATAERRTEYEEAQRLKRKLAAAEAREKALRDAMVRIIALRIADVGLCDSCPPNDSCSQCEARNALANTGVLP